MAKTIQIRVDDKIKNAADDLYSGLGLDISTAVRMFLYASLQAGGLPFEVRQRFNMDTITAMEDVRKGKNLSGPYNSVKEAMAAMLESDETSGE
jgi:DNA-damage-inducible protein J